MYIYVYIYMIYIYIMQIYIYIMYIYIYIIHVHKCIFFILSQNTFDCTYTYIHIGMELRPALLLQKGLPSSDSQRVL